MSWFAQAPSNIALIKYMGKKNSTEKNIPDNASISYTLNHLLSDVSLELNNQSIDRWEPLTPDFSLSSSAQKRFLSHLQRLKDLFGYTGHFVVRSHNNFPHSSGLASSASSFAALTRCAVLALSELTHTPLPSTQTQAHLSREGSGSSCRSFFSPWAMWDSDVVEPISLPYTQLLHQVIIINRSEKSVSSSEAHQRVLTSPYYENRTIRAQNNIKQLLQALTALDWGKAFEICWTEFQDMHRLFETSAEPFAYITDETKTVLAQLKSTWQKQGDGPLVTMDAGPNIHLLYRMDQKDMAEHFKKEHLDGQYDVI